MYSIESVCFNVIDEDGKSSRMIVYVHCPDFTFSEHDLSQLIMQGIEDIFKPNLYLEGVNLIKQAN